MLSANYTVVKLIGNGSTHDFSFAFAIIAAANIRVYLEDITTGVQTLQTAYTLTFDDSTPGGTVHFTTAPTSQDYVVIGRNVAQTQEVGYKTSSGFDGEVVEQSFDKLTAEAQDLQEQMDRTVKLALGSSATGLSLPAPEALKLLGWNAAGDGLENKLPVDTDVLVATEAAKDAAIVAKLAAQTAQGLAEAARDAAQAVAGWNIASQAEAEAGTDNTKVMTPLRVKNEVQKSGAVSIPGANINIPYIKVSDTVAQGAAAQNSVANAWTKRNINTEDSDVGGVCSIAANQITLAAGTYDVFITSPFTAVDTIKLRLRNITDSSDALVGENAGIGVTSVGGIAPLRGRFTIAAQKTFEIQYYTNAGGYAMGKSGNVTGYSEIYTIAEFRKVS